MTTEEPIRYCYKFMIDSEVIIEIPILLNPETLALMSAPSDSIPEWASLTCFQCPNCPLNRVQTPDCPIAVNISELMRFFSGVSSYQTVEVHVHTQARNYTMQTSVQQALSSILGIYMTTSGCPILDKLRPMVRFHLPFSSYEETSYRALSMYLVIQYLRHKEGKTTDWNLNEFVAMYKEIQLVNHAFNQRLQKISNKDANSNALIILNCFAALITINAELEQLVPEELQNLFKPFLN